MLFSYIMKYFIILILLSLCSCRSEDTSEITRKIHERDRDGDGNPDSRIEQVFRGDLEVMIVFWSKTSPTGEWVVTSRSYSAGTNMVMIESDQDGDGLFETLATYGSKPEDMQVFSRNPDGLVQPASPQNLAAHRKQTEAFEKFFGSLDKTMSDDELTELLNETQKKIQEAEIEKSASPK